MNDGIRKELHRKGNSLKRFRPFSESPDSKTSREWDAVGRKILKKKNGKTRGTRVFGGEQSEIHILGHLKSGKCKVLIFLRV